MGRTIFNNNLYFPGYESLSMPFIFDRFCPILAIGKKKNWLKNTEMIWVSVYSHLFKHNINLQE